MSINENSSGGKHHCSNCYELYNTEIELQQHMCYIKRRNTKQVKEKKFKCEICGKFFSVKMSLKSHIRCVHEGIKHFSCAYCHYRSYTNQSMTTHLATHTGVKNYKCTHCDYASVQKGHLTAHINRHHTNKTYRCRFKGCGVSKTSQEELFEHIRSDQTCPMSFNNLQKLKLHSRTHTGDKPYKCEVCEKKFNDKSNSYSHKVTHTGEKRFSCSHCDIKFSHNNSKSRHEITCKYE